MSSYGTNNLAVALLFSRLDGVDNIDFSGCDEVLGFKPLSEMDVDWKYSGHGNLSMGNTDVESVRYMWSSRKLCVIIYAILQFIIYEKLGKLLPNS